MKSACFQRVMPFSAADLHGEGSGGRLKGQLLMSTSLPSNRGKLLELRILSALVAL
jgi:hypothetical protein